jgi:hypothetical protein
MTNREILADWADNGVLYDRATCDNARHVAQAVLDRAASRETITTGGLARSTGWSVMTGRLVDTQWHPDLDGAKRYVEWLLTGGRRP